MTRQQRQQFAERYGRSRNEQEACAAFVKRWWPEETAHRLARNIARSAGRKETVMRTLVCLEVFDERGLIQLKHTTDHLHIALRSVEGKVDLDESWIMRRLRGMSG